MLVFSVGCEEEIQPEISLEKNEVMLPSEGGTLTVGFSSNLDYIYDVSFTGSTSWFTVSASGSASDKSVSIKVEPNDSYSERWAKIVFRHREGALSASLKITQDQNDALIVADKEFEFDYKGGDFTVDVESNVEYEIEISEDWVSEAQAKALKKDKLVFHVQNNPMTTERKAVITLRYGSNEELILVKQGLRPEIVLNKDNVMLSREGGMVDVEVTSNCDYNVRISDEGLSWISAVENESSSTVHGFMVGLNETYSNRSAEIYFLDSASEVGDTLRIIQSQTDAIILDDKEFVFDYKEYDFIVETESNVEYEVEISADWVQEVKTKALEARQLSFHVQGNRQAAERETVITLKHQNVTERIMVKQTGKADRIFLELLHSENLFYPPVWSGGYIFGSVDWGDGTEEEYRDGLMHEFRGASGNIKTRYDMYGVLEVNIDTLRTISSIVIEYEPVSAE